MIFKPVRTPCVGVCSTGMGGNVCRGCKRFAHEVIDWNAYSNEQRYTIVKRLEALLSQVVAAKVQVLSETLLKEQLEHQQIRFNRDSDPYCWVFDLLKAGARQIEDLEPYGLALQPEWGKCQLVEVRDAIDQDFFTLSSAHFDRYIAPGLLQQA